jgi:hypothetical protein
LNAIKKFRRKEVEGGWVVKLVNENKKKKNQIKINNKKVPFFSK